MNARGPMTFSGKSQVVGTDAGFWVATLSNFIVRTPDHIREWRALVADLQGGLNDLVIGAFDCKQIPRVDGLPVVIRSPFAENGALVDGPWTSRNSIRVSANGAASMRSTTLVLEVGQAGPLKKGMYFTIRTLIAGVLVPRMYMITREPEVVGSKATVRFLPPLRHAVDAGADVDFTNPEVAMNLSSDDEGELDIRMRRFSSPSLNLQESWNGLS
ncbi:hypothetical protein J3A65_000332 [Rhizobium sp. PvP014]|nr:hypothetical protein [Rhizobium sp. PvP099]MBP2459582.1 hypothetical protein [Rhizobium sp. PvP014]MBP2531876.1 hypothetical protein [Rhizobium sp. PvP099]